ncbi:hypothetical protein PF008_g29007 [Phytophthora fragariae]|uniref:Uncharacterized protein n=1 Tax=Phytophthora fragariae TaxID=53985 RepID=A0A6G0Q9P4_9STRA|nr:hypothetical protein PF008_g29007 [Phytophthora fragariae]
MSSIPLPCSNNFPPQKVWANSSVSFTVMVGKSFSRCSTYDTNCGSLSLICSSDTLLNEISPSIVMFLAMGKRPLRTFIRADLPDPGWPSSSVIFPGAKRPLMFLRISLRTVSFLGPMRVFLSSFGMVGSSYLVAWSSATTMSADSDRLL